MNDVSKSEETICQPTSYRDCRPLKAACGERVGDTCLSTLTCVELRGRTTKFSANHLHCKGPGDKLVRATNEPDETGGAAVEPILWSGRRARPEIVTVWRGRA